MDDPGARTAPVASYGAVVVCLLLIVVVLLGIGNEIRFQGCVARQDQKNLIEATKNPDNPERVDFECSRVPFRAG